MYLLHRDADLTLQAALGINKIVNALVMHMN
jgi:hypothetical protein